MLKWFQSACSLFARKNDSFAQGKKFLFILINSFLINLKARTKLIRVIKMNRWMGRTGNNIIQLINASIFSERYGVQILIPPKNFFVRETSLNEKIKFYSGLGRNRESFYYNTCLFPMASDAEHKRAFQNIRPFVDGGQKIKPLSAMAIHIRSGDIFLNRHPLYWQPPLNFYRKVIPLAGDLPIYIVFDGSKLNPVIDILISEFGSRIELVSSDAMSDYRMLMAASHLVMSNSTFASTAAFLSLNLKHLFVFAEWNSFQEKPFKAHVSAEIHTFHSKSYEDYFAKNPWTASPAQIELMLSCDDILEKNI